MIWQSIVGLFGLISIAWVMSENRRKVSWKGILVGLLIQFILVSLLLKVSAFRHVFEFLNRAVMVLADWNSLVRSPSCRFPDGNQNHPQRVYCLY